MRKRISRSMLLVAVLAMVVTCALVAAMVVRLFEDQNMKYLQNEAKAICYGMQYAQDETAYAGGLEADYRITLIDRDGSVLYDSAADSDGMENHASRPEIVNAAETGFGESRRYSDTLSRRIFYYAARTPQGRIIRIANTQSSVLGVYVSILPTLFWMLILISVAVLVLARRITAWIVKPVNSLNLDSPMLNAAYDELAPLLVRIEIQKHEIASHVQSLERALSERNAITDRMREGLILLGANGEVLMLNRSAAAIFGIAEQDCTGESLFGLIPDEALAAQVKSALAGKNVTALMEKNGRCHRLFASPVSASGLITGAVVLMLDVTESNNAEISRREFTANVSHELKTPLTSILGFAEIIRGGGLREEETCAFAQRIHKEASRLIQLLQDIFELAKLDEEKGFGKMEETDLLDVSMDALARLESASEEKGVRIRLDGDSVFVNGYRTLIAEMLYNLIDNAIRYTPKGGLVEIETACAEGKSIVRVRDNGIGIAPEHHARVFERFYRVDKGRSRASGGTGLGLAIVKHAALIHNAGVKLESEPGKGTCITVSFPGEE